MARWHRRFPFRSRSRPRFRSMGWAAALMLVLPLVLSACGETAAPTATTGAATTAPTGAAAMPTRAASPAATTAATTVTTGSGTAAAPVGTTASGTTAAAPVTAAGSPFGVPLTTRRGEGGTLRLLYWQAPTVLNVHLSNGTKDTEAANVVLEPLARITADSVVPNIPILAKEIPTTQNGQISADYTTVTWKLKEGVTWSDGTPFTAEDVKFTFEWVSNPKNGSTSINTYSDIKQVDAMDATTARITYKAPAAAWFLPFVGDSAIIPKHVVSGCTAADSCPFNLKPIGTGAFAVQEFRPGDSVLYVANERFREPNAPFFAKVEMKGGGDAGTAAKAVQTAQADFAWNLTITPDQLKQITDAGKTLASHPGVYVELMNLNNADPRVEVDGELSSPKSKNPFFSDPKVREAFKYVIDRNAIATNLYGAGGVAGNTLVPILRGDKGGPWSYDLNRAGQLLDEAGWRRGADGIREKGGVKMNMTFRSSITPVRDRQAQIIQQSLRTLGINLEIKSVDSSVFFGRPDNPDSSARFTVDMTILATGSTRPDVQVYFEGLTTEKITQKSNNWSGGNSVRYSDAGYDALFNQFRAELNADKRTALAKQLDEYIVKDGVRIPIVLRNSVSAHRPDLVNLEFSPWSVEVWNIAHWTIKK